MYVKIGCGRRAKALSQTEPMSKDPLRKSQETRFKNLTAKKSAVGWLETQEEKELTRLAGLLLPHRRKGDG